MDAVIATGGKQYRVTPGQVIKVERLGKAKGATVEFSQVLLVNEDGKVTVEPKALKSAKVTGEVVVERKDPKVLVVKFKRRKNYRRHRGHRQVMTAVRITKIEIIGRKRMNRNSRLEKRPMVPRNVAQSHTVPAYMPHDDGRKSRCRLTTMMM